MCCLQLTRYCSNAESEDYWDITWNLVSYKRSPRLPNLTIRAWVLYSAFIIQCAHSWKRGWEKERAIFMSRSRPVLSCVHTADHKRIALKLVYSTWETCLCLHPLRVQVWMKGLHQVCAVLAEPAWLAQVTEFSNVSNLTAANVNEFTALLPCDCYMFA